MNFSNINHFLDEKIPIEEVIKLHFYLKNDIN